MQYRHGHITSTNAIKLHSPYEMQVPGVLEARSSGTFQSSNCCLAGEDDAGVRVGREQEERGRKSTEFCSVLFIVLWLDTHFSPILKERERQDTSLLPPSALPKLSSSFPQVHKTIKYPLK